MTPGHERDRMWERVLLATDGSTAAHPAERLAQRVARACGAALRIVSVVPFEPWRDRTYDVNRLYLEERQREVRTDLAAMAVRARAAGLAVTTHEPVGIPSQEILACASAWSADLLILGTQGRTGLDHVLIGSTAERVVRIAPCSVLTVRASAPVEAAGGEASSPEQAVFRRILVPLDFSESSPQVLREAVRLARRCGATLTLLHVVEPVGYGVDFTVRHALSGSALREDLQKTVEARVAECRAQGVAAEGQVVPGVPVDVIVRDAEAAKSELIVMGTHGRRGWSHLRFGSVAEAVVRYAPCPVLTVRCGRDGGGASAGVPIGSPAIAT